MNRVTPFAFALIFAVLSVPCASQAQVELYAAEVAVQGEDAEERSRAMAEAMQAVLVKLTGTRDVAGRGGFDAIVAAAPGLVQQYRYRVEPVAGDGSPSRFLYARFDSAAVDRVLAEQGWQVWGPPRPRVLVWLTAEQLGQRRFVNPDAAPEVSAALRRAAGIRGIPLQWPLLDLEDQSKLTTADLWGGFEEGIRAASERYGEGPILVGRLKAQPGGDWRPEWVLYDRTGAQAFAGGAGDLPQVLAEGVNLATDLLAGRYGPAPTTGSSASVRVRVQGIQTLSDYAQALELVGRAAGVNRISLRRAQGELLAFDVWIDGDAASLAEGLSLESQLQRLPGADPDPGQLSYVWVP